DLMDQGEKIFQEMRGYSLLELMFGKSKEINSTENTQPSIFISSAAIYKYLQSKGFEPDAFIGHSIGEYSALYCSGILDFEDAMRLIIKRSDLMKKAADDFPGKIMVVFKNAGEVLSLIDASNIKNVYVANKNSENQTAVSGNEAEINDFCAFLKTKKVMFKKLALSGAFHTPLFKTAADQLKDYIGKLRFNDVDYSRIIANVTAEPYPNDAKAVKEILVKQITSPVEFVKSIENARASGMTHFIEVGPGKILINLLKNINIKDYTCLPAVDPKAGQVKSLDALVKYLEENGKISLKPVLPVQKPAVSVQRTQAEKVDVPLPADDLEVDLYKHIDGDMDFETFLQENDDALKKVLYKEFLKSRREKAIESIEKFNFFTGKVAISGVSIGLPGTGNKVFNSDNFDKLLTGSNFIEPLNQQEKERIVDMNLTRVFKDPEGHAKFVKIESTEEVIQLAGKLGYFNLKNEYGIDFDYDITTSLAIGAGIEALKDAHIPLVLNYKTTSTGKQIPDGFCLPEQMQENTGVIITSLFPGYETLIKELNNYYYNKFYVKPYDELENIYYHLMESVKDKEVKEQITDWFFKIKERRKEYGTYEFDRNLLLNIIPLGSAHFAQLVKAKGPNMQLSGACATTTQAVGVAEDWIRSGRCDRVIIIGGEAATSQAQGPWICSGFLALGAATVKKTVAEAAKPFDVTRNGTILGSGAVSIIVEREDRIKKRGFNGQAEVLGTYMGNSAFHATKIDVNHLAEEMNRFMSGVEERHHIEKKDYTGSMVFMSHETFTPARGGSAAAEVSAIKNTFPDHYRDITITNTKGFTGHTLGVGLEDAVIVKALQKGLVPPIANLKNIPDEFKDLNLNKKNRGSYDYALHFSAGFGSHFSFLFIRKIKENTVDNNSRYHKWLMEISGSSDPLLTVIDNALCVKPDDAAPVLRSDRAAEAVIDIQKEASEEKVSEVVVARSLPVS
ncbi:MAG: acyltransferase domain-containing protein, partial [Deltaproteobacteria bacterium]|nr:acyltransferase domain-containing protein [Deltaproteobacteria bacterium]